MKKISDLQNKELIINGDFEQGKSGWQAINLSLKASTPEAVFEIVNKPQFEHIIDKNDKLIKGNYALFRAGDIHTWLTLESGVYLPAGEYVWSFAVKTYSTHIMFGVYSTNEVGCDDRLIFAENNSCRKDNLGESWNNFTDFVLVRGKYQMEWSNEQLPRYNTVKYYFKLNKPTTVFPAIRGRAESAKIGNESVGLQALYIDGMSIKCVEEYEQELIEDKEYIAKFQTEKPVQNGDYAGLSAVFPCFWFLTDSMLDNPYTEEQIRLSVNKFLKMGISIVRCLAFEPSYAWDGEKHCWDWESDWMTGFYRYCDIMKENGIDIVLNPAEGLASKITHLGRENPIYYLALKNNPSVFENFNVLEKTEEQIEAFRDELTKWVEAFAKEVIIKRGYDNIKYWMEGTEVNNSSSKDSKFYQWMGWASAVHRGFKNVNMRDKIKIVGPATAYDFNFPASKASTWRWLKLCIEEFEEVIDIYAAHTYGLPYVMGDDVSEQYIEFTNSCLDITKKTNKPFWHDEFNVFTNFGSYTESAEQPKHATHIALGHICTMTSGSNTTMLWYPVDIKWPNRDVTRFPSWENGVHILGLDTSVLNGTAVPRYGYYTYCMLGSAVKPGDTIYKAEFDENNQLYTVLLRHNDGKYSIITVNMANEENNIVYSIPDIDNISFKRSVYDPNTFELPKDDEVGIGIDEFTEPTPANKLIVPIDTVFLKNGKMMDKIAPYQVVVYNQ